MRRINLAEEWKIEGSEPILFGGSTHPGEERILLESFRSIEKKISHVLLIIVPKHPQRAIEIEMLIKEKGYSYIKRTQMRDLPVEEKIVLVDTIGKLLQVYTLADVVFIGGSLVLKKGINHSSCLFCKAIVTDPHTFNFEELIELLKENKGIVQIEDKEHLEEAILSLLLNSEEKQKLGKDANNMLQSNQEATKKNLEIIGELFKGKPR